MPPPYRSYVLVSLGQIARNYRNVCAAVGAGVEVSPEGIAKFQGMPFHEGTLPRHRTVRAGRKRGFSESRVMRPLRSP